MRATEFTSSPVMAKIELTGQIVQILRHADHVKFSDDVGWFLVNTEPGRRTGTSVKWIPDSTRFSWVKNFESLKERKTQNYQGIDISISIDKDDEYVDDDDVENQTMYVQATSGGKELGHVLFTMEYDSQGLVLNPQDLEVDERFRGQGIAAIMYDYVKRQGYRIRRSGQQTDAGRGFWQKHRPSQNVWESQWRLPAAIEEFLDSLNPDDCGVEDIGPYRIYFEGFTSDCKSSADYRRDPEAVYQQVYQDFVQREGGARPLVQDMVGDEDFPILYSIFRRKKTVAEDKQEYLYHATYRPLLKSIRAKGLGNTTQSQWTDSEPGVVYLARDPEVARSYAEAAESVPEAWLDQIVVLQIPIGDLDPKRLRIDRNVQDNRGDTMEYHSIIPASKIKTLNEQQPNQTRQATARQVLAYINQTHHEPFRPGEKMYAAVMAHPQWELRRVPLLNLNIPDQEYDDVDYDEYEPESDPYGRVMTVEPGHAGEVSQHLVDRQPIVIDADRYIIDGNHRAWAAKYLLNRDYINAWVPVKKLNEVNYPDELTVSDQIQEYFFRRGYELAGEGRDQMAFESPRGTILKVLGIGEDEREQVVRQYVAFFEQNQRNPFYPRIYNSGNFEVDGETYFVYEMERVNYVANEEATLDYIEKLMSAVDRGQGAEYVKQNPVPEEIGERQLAGLLQATERMMRALGGTAPLDLSAVENLGRRNNGHLVIVDPYSL